MNNETTPNLYTSKDQLVSIRILDQPQHWPIHKYKCLVLRVLPKNHERVRELKDGRIEVMLTKAELHALVLGFSQCDPEFGVTLTRPMINKPIERQEKWRQINRKRVNQGKFYPRHRPRRRRY